MAKKRELTPATRSLIARIAINTRVSQPDYDGKAATAAARRGSWEHWLDQVDPERVLPEEERNKKAKAARQAAMLRGKLDKAMDRPAKNVRARKAEARNGN